MRGSQPADESMLLEGAVEHLLVSGGDGRLELHVRSGLNRYGCAPWPRDALPLGSCTSSSPTRYAIEAARAAQLRLREAHAAGEQLRFAQAELDRLRLELASWIHVDRVPGSGIVLTPSGTDAEVLASVLALADGARPLCNIISGPSEVGSGTALAAAGRHFSDRTPCGGPRTAGDPLAGALSEQVRIEAIILRDSEGDMRPPGEIDADAAHLVAEAIASGERVLLHVVAHSKTGAHAPSLAAVARLRRRHGCDVSVLVDAAQGRFSRRGLTDALEAGYMLLFTGSKFYGGPSFSGALIVPPSMAPDVVGVRSLPEGARDYFTAGELPADWEGLRAGLPDRPNLGLVVRWAAAMAEIRAYYEADASARYQVLRAFERLVPQELGRSPCITLQAVDPPILSDDAERLLESKTTVFPFYLHTSARRREFFSHELLSRVFSWINTPISHLLAGVTEEEASILRQCFHLGQPVKLTEENERSVLRVALGGPLIVRLSQDTSIGTGLEERIAWLQGQIVRLRRKLELIAENYEVILEQEES